MEQALIAERLAELHGIIDQTKRRDRLVVTALALVVGSTTWLATDFGTGLAAGTVAGVVASIPVWLRRASARRRLAQLERDHPEKVAVAMDRYRLAMASLRAERWKVFR